MVHLRKKHRKTINMMSPQEFFKNDVFAENAGIVLLEVSKGYSKTKPEVAGSDRAGSIKYLWLEFYCKKAVDGEPLSVRV